MQSILAQHISKKFPGAEKSAVDDLSLAIDPGEAVAFLGPNGAGKSTTIKMLCGILTPDQGSCSIMGNRSGSQQANLFLGVVFGARSQLYFNMKVIDGLSLTAEAYYITGREKTNRINQLAELFEASHLLEQRTRTLSLGERMRCEIIASLLHNPKVILLDEPTIGLDIKAKYKLRESLKTWQEKEKTTMLLTSHDLSDVQALCDRCILINHGVKTYDGPLEKVKGSLGQVRRIKLVLSEIRSKNHQANPAIHPILASEDYERLYEFSLHEISTNQVLNYLSEAYGDNIVDIQLTGVSLEEVIHQHYSSLTT